MSSNTRFYIFFTVFVVDLLLKVRDIWCRNSQGEHGHIIFFHTDIFFTLRATHAIKNSVNFAKNVVPPGLSLSPLCPPMYGSSPTWVCPLPGGAIHKRSPLPVAEPPWRTMVVINGICEQNGKLMRQKQGNVLEVRKKQRKSKMSQGEWSFWRYCVCRITRTEASSLGCVWKWWKKSEIHRNWRLCVFCGFRLFLRAQGVWKLVRAKIV